MPIEINKNKKAIIV